MIGFNPETFLYNLDMMDYMKKSVVLILIISLFLVGCGQRTPDIACDEPYIRHDQGCCMDQNSNDLCDDDEDIMFEPDYAPTEELPTYEDLKDVTVGEPVYEEPVYEEPVYEEAEERVYEEAEEPKILTPDPEKVEADEPKKSAYTVPEPELRGWEAENDFMSIKVTDITIEVIDITPRDRISPDKEVYLKEMRFTIKNKDYNYLNPKLHFRVMDDRDTQIIRETLLCDLSDDLTMEGCVNALPEGDTMEISMVIDRKIPRLELDKTIRLVLENKRYMQSANVLEIENTQDILKISGAKYV
jgi:hypothetical protein